MAVCHSSGLNKEKMCSYMEWDCDDGNSSGFCNNCQKVSFGMYFTIGTAALASLLQFFVNFSRVCVDRTCSRFVGLITAGISAFFLAISISIYVGVCKASIENNTDGSVDLKIGTGMWFAIAWIILELILCILSFLHMCCAPSIAESGYMRNFGAR